MTDAFGVTVGLGLEPPAVADSDDPGEGIVFPLAVTWRIPANTNRRLYLAPGVVLGGSLESTRESSKAIGQVTGGVEVGRRDQFHMRVTITAFLSERIGKRPGLSFAWPF